VLGAGQLLQEEAVAAQPAQRGRFARMVVENSLAMQGLLDDLIVLSRTDTDVRQQRHVLLPEAVAEVFRQLREMARARGVGLRVADGIPSVEVNAAAVELALVNLLSNAVKYADPGAAERWVEVRASIVAGEVGYDEVVLEVRDNGIGVEPESRDQLFQRFFRAPGNPTH
jgi:signal transduction histidine kinase